VTGRGRDQAALLKNIQRRHFNAMAAQCGVGESVEPQIQGILGATPTAIASVQKYLLEARRCRARVGTDGGRRAPAVRGDQSGAVG